MSTSFGAQREPAKIAESQLLEAAEIAHPGNRQAVAYWARLKGDRLLPLIADFHPRDVANLLPGIVVWDVIEGPPLDFFCRLVGENNKLIAGIDFTGHKVSTYDAYGPALRDHILETLAVPCRRKAVFGLSGNLSWAGRAYQSYEIALLPFSRTGDTVDRLIETVCYD